MVGLDTVAFWVCLHDVGLASVSSLPLSIFPARLVFFIFLFSSLFMLEGKHILSVEMWLNTYFVLFYIDKIADFPLFILDNDAFFHVCSFPNSEDQKSAIVHLAGQEGVTLCPRKDPFPDQIA